MTREVKIPKKKDVRLALRAATKLVHTLIDNPDELNKLPKKSILLPKEKIIIPYTQVKRIGEFVVLPKAYSVEKLKKEFLTR